MGERERERLGDTEVDRPNERRTEKRMREIELGRDRERERLR